MSLKKSEGNMYPWVTHMHAHLGGICPHLCKYCYVDSPRFGRHERHDGPVRLIESEFAVNYHTGKTIFIENTNDLFAAAIPAEFIRRILGHCAQWPDCEYVFQTKNPVRYTEFLDLIPENSFLGTTIETNRPVDISTAPAPELRFVAMRLLRCQPKRFRYFITIEPVLDCDPAVLAGWLEAIRPDFVNIGADSKKHGLTEPTADTLRELLAQLDARKIPIRVKSNLARILPTPTAIAAN